MTLAVQGIMHDSFKKVAVITFTDVLDDGSQISATMRLTTLGSQTRDQIHSAIKAHAKALLIEAIQRLDQFKDL